MRASPIFRKYARERMVPGLQGTNHCLIAWKDVKDRDACVERKIRIPTQEGVRKPDLVKHQNRAYVIDGQVVTDNADLYEVHESKIRYYDKTEIKNFVKNRFPDVFDKVFFSVTQNWRGEICDRSVKLVEVDLGLSTHLKSTLAIKVLLNGVRLCKHFQSSTFALKRGKQLDAMQLMTV